VISSSGTGEVSGAPNESSRKYVGRGLPNSFTTVNGGSLLSLLPLRSSSSNFLARSLLWKANASRGDSAGGTAPVCGVGKLPFGVRKYCCTTGMELSVDDRSMKLGRSAIVAGSSSERQLGSGLRQSIPRLRQMSQLFAVVAVVS